MTSRQHQNWINQGRPDSGLALPLQLLANTLVAAGYTVYTYPNDAHLDAQPPEDHTYYSETGWPQRLSPKWWRHAIDIMPPTRVGLPSLQVLGQRIFDARQAGRITWVKYMNWPSDGDLSRAVQDRWEPDHQRGSSSDTGHIHLSSTTGCETLSDPFNPLVVEQTPAPSSPRTQETTLFYAIDEKTNRRYLCDGARSWPVTLEREAVLRQLHNDGLIDIKADKQGRSTLEFPRAGWTEAYGALQDGAPTPPAVIVPASGDVTVTGTLHLGPQV